VKSSEIRESFLSFFESKGSTRYPSSSLIPDDPSLLLTTAGMVQFKPAFLGLKDFGFTRATTCQKCVRTTDIDIIGTTGRHHSFFEMLGNFSFGDYFKREAIRWSWEYSTEVLGLDPERIWASIFEDDDESEGLWLEESDVPAERIVRMGAADNFWAAGPTGPCGPCSELYYDQGEALGCGSEDCAPGCDCDRYVEYWNLVFMQYERHEDGTLEPLPKQNIDTGMGLERVATIMQGVQSNFETDILRRLLGESEAITGVTYGSGGKSDTSLRIIADHARAVSFMIADGILPSNEGRGYVLRRLMRRAMRHGRMLGVDEPFMVRMVDLVVELMGDAYHELIEQQELIERIVASEEERFGATLRQGLSFLEGELAALETRGEQQLAGETAFVLHDTYGFPLELTAEIVAERGLQVDLDRFHAEMEAQRERARAHVKDESWSTFGGLFTDLAQRTGPTEFVGYELDEADANVIALVADGALVDTVSAGTTVEVILDLTPFYGEQGGQVGDAGRLEAEGGALVSVEDTQIREGLYAHIGQVTEGELSVGDRVRAAIDVARRERIRRNHTATHLLHWALRLVLGEHVRQGGSRVGPDRLRFDYTHFEAPSADQLAKVEAMVNAKIFENHEVRAYETSLATAREAGVTALFGEKYGEFVRVLECGSFSKELCGGTHVSRTSEINLFKLITEGSVGANLRRIEANTSFDAYNYVRAEETELEQAAVAFRVPPNDVAERAAASVKRIKELENVTKTAKALMGEGEIGRLLGTVVDVGYPLLVAHLGEGDGGQLRGFSDVLRQRMGGGAVVLAVKTPDDGVILLAAGDDGAVASGFDAGRVIKETAPLVGGRGGGKPSMAQGGGTNAGGIEAALDRARTMLGAPAAQV
jgi:alanyl-tRNA synthetase